VLAVVLSVVVIVNTTGEVDLLNVGLVAVTREDVDQPNTSDHPHIPITGKPMTTVDVDNTRGS